MKTKTNKVPLVGPRGRRELLDRIEELEKKVSELAQAGGGAAKILTIHNFNGGDIGPIGKDEFATALGITVGELDALFDGLYPFMTFPDAYGTRILNAIKSGVGTDREVITYTVEFSEEGGEFVRYVHISKEVQGYSIGEI